MSFFYPYVPCFGLPSPSLIRRSTVEWLHRRYKYLQRPLEQSTLPNLMQYMNRWPAAQREKIATATGLLIAQGLASAACLQSLTKDHLVKDGTFHFT